MVYNGLKRLSYFSEVFKVSCRFKKSRNDGLNLNKFEFFFLEQSWHIFHNVKLLQEMREMRTCMIQ